MVKAGFVGASDGVGSGVGNVPAVDPGAGTGVARKPMLTGYDEVPGTFTVVL